jgi:hypothetical protein
MVVRETTLDDPAPAVTPIRRHPRGMRATLLAVAAVAGLGLLTGCGGGSATTATTGSTGSTSSVSTATTPGAAPAAGPDYTLNTAPAARAGKVPEPSDSQRQQLVYILEAVNPGVSTDETSLTAKSVEVCGHMLGGDSSAAIAEETRQQFTSGSYTPSPEEVQAMDMAITATFCR